MLKNRRVHIHSDNTAAQHNTAKGRARSFDHTCLIHGIWYVEYPVAFHFGPLFWVRVPVRTEALLLNMSLHVSRVASKARCRMHNTPLCEGHILVKSTHLQANIADDPSRERYSLLRKFKAQFVPPVLKQRFLQAQEWEALKWCCAEHKILPIQASSDAVAP